MNPNSRLASLVIVRHGESVLNELMRGSGAFCRNEEVAQKMREIPDQIAPLTTLGQQQAIELGQRFRIEFGEEGFDAIYHSGWVRARDTALLIKNAQDRGTPPVTCDPRLRERDPGYGYGMTEPQFHTQFPWMQQYYLRTGWFFQRPPGGESLADLYNGRVRQAIDDILIKHIDQRVLVVCHGRVAQVIQVLVQGPDAALNRTSVPHLPNCGYLTIPSPSLS